MNWGNMKIVLVSTATVAVASQIAINLYRKLTTSKTKLKELTNESSRKPATVKEREINDVLLFSDQIDYQYVKIPQNVKDVKVCESREMNCVKLIRYIKAANETLDVCMYLITSNEIAEHIIRLGEKHILVRILVDSDMAYTSGSQIKRLKQYSFIQVQTSKRSALMHHKFCIIDGPLAVRRKNKLKEHAEKLNVFGKKPFYFCKRDYNSKKIKGFVMSGSLNWSTQAMAGNYDNVVVTSHENVVSKFEKEFARLWIEDDPAVLSG